jgi:hypothetical protein
MTERVIRWSPLLVWGVLVLEVGWGTLLGPFDEAGRAYGANWPGDTSRTLALGTVETLVWAALVRPWSFRSSWGRALLAALLFAPWALVNLIVCMHCGRIAGGRSLWLLVVALCSGIAAVESFRRARLASEHAVA